MNRDRKVQLLKPATLTNGSLCMYRYLNFSATMTYKVKVRLLLGVQLNLRSVRKVLKARKLWNLSDPAVDRVAVLSKRTNLANARSAWERHIAGSVESPDVCQHHEEISHFGKTPITSEVAAKTAHGPEVDVVLTSDSQAIQKVLIVLNAQCSRNDHTIHSIQIIYRASFHSEGTQGRVLMVDGHLAVRKFYCSCAAPQVKESPCDQDYSQRRVHRHSVFGDSVMRKMKMKIKFTYNFSTWSSIYILHLSKRSFM